MDGSTVSLRSGAQASQAPLPPPGAGGARPADPAQRQTLAVLVLGLNLWAALLLWPLLGQSARGSELALALACLLPLLLGAAVQSEVGARVPARRWVAGALFLTVFPALLGGTLVVRPEALNQQMFGPAGLLLVWLSLCAYGASAAAACATRAPELVALGTPLDHEPWDVPEAERGRPQRVATALWLLGAAAIAVVAPALGGLPALERAWGDAALAGGVLTAVVGAALGAASLSVFLGGALRADAGGHEPRAEMALRVAWFLFLALLGGVTYFVVQK